MKDKYLYLKFEIILIVLFALIIIFAIGTNDMECSKAQNICNIYERRGFSRELTDTFRLTDIKHHYIDYYNGTGRYSHGNYKVCLNFDNGTLFLPFGTRSEEAAENIYTNIMVQPEYKLKGTYFKTFFDLY